MLNNKGSMIVEGAMVIPLIIIISISAIYLLMDFYVMVVNETIQDSKVFEAGFNEGSNIRKAIALGDILKNEE